MKRIANRTGQLFAGAFAVLLTGAGCGGRSDLLASLDAASFDSSPLDASSSDAEVHVVPRSGGCGKPLPSTQAMTVPGRRSGYTQYTVMGTGATLDGTIAAKAGPRTFWVRVPANYDPNHKYRAVYIGQGCGGYNSANVSTYPLYDEKVGGNEQAIYVAMDIPTDEAYFDCYDDHDGPRSQEWEAFELFHSVVDATYCVDDDNIFVAGNTTGGTLANMWGCYFAGDGRSPWNGQAGGRGDAEPRTFAPRYHIRGQAVLNGVEPDNNPPCNGPIAAIWIHDMNASLPYSGDQAALARVLRMNGCEGSPTEPWHAELDTSFKTCVRYSACPARTLVVFCTTVGFGTSGQPDVAIPAFTLFFDEASGVARSADAGAD